MDERGLLLKSRSLLSILHNRWYIIKTASTYFFSACKCFSWDSLLQLRDWAVQKSWENGHCFVVKTQDSQVTLQTDFYSPVCWCICFETDFHTPDHGERAWRKWRRNDHSLAFPMQNGKWNTRAMGSSQAEGNGSLHNKIHWPVTQQNALTCDALLT